MGALRLVGVSKRETLASSSPGCAHGSLILLTDGAHVSPSQLRNSLDEGTRIFLRPSLARGRVMAGRSKRPAVHLERFEGAHSGLISDESSALCHHGKDADALASDVMPVQL